MRNAIARRDKIIMGFSARTRDNRDAAARALVNAKRRVAIYTGDRANESRVFECSFKKPRGSHVRASLVTDDA